MLKNICLYQFASCYVKGGQEEKEDEDIPVPSSDILLVIDNDDYLGEEFLPKSITLTNGELMKLRKSAKIVSFPVVGNSIKTEVKLYRRHFHEAQVVGLEEVLYQELDNFAEIIEDKPLTKIETVKMRLNFPIASINYDLYSGEDFVHVKFGST